MVIAFRSGVRDQKMVEKLATKEVQKLTGCVTSLSKFISRIREKGLPVFKLLKKNDHFLWTP